MNSDPATLRDAAEPYKSFPVAVAAVVRAMFDKGAKWVRIAYDSTQIGQPRLLRVTCDAWWCKGGDLLQAASHVDPDRRPAWALAFVHHSQRYETTDESFVFVDIGAGDGVNSKQDRSAARLVRELPRFLSPNEAFNTVVIDEADAEHRLAKNLRSTIIDGFRVSWPEKMIGFGGRGLTLKFGSVRVDMSGFIESLIRDDIEPAMLALLTHPWLRGTIEIEVIDPQKANISEPREADNNFSFHFYQSGRANRLAEMILRVVPTVVHQEIYRVIQGSVRHYAPRDAAYDLEYIFGGLIISCASLDEIAQADRQIVWYVPDSSAKQHRVSRLFLDVTHPVLRTIDPSCEEIMHVIWWQLAMWIAENYYTFEKVAVYRLRVNEMYLDLRRKNPERRGE